MTKNEDISNPFEVTERKTLAVQNIVDKNKYFTILFFSQHYTRLDTCPKYHPFGIRPTSETSVDVLLLTSVKESPIRNQNKLSVLQWFASKLVNMPLYIHTEECYTDSSHICMDA